MLEKPSNRDDAFAIFSEHFVILAQASRANAKFVARITGHGEG